MVKVLAHFLPQQAVMDTIASERNWLEIRWCHEDDEATLHRELPWADVVWHVLRPLTGDELRICRNVRLVQKFGAGVNTVDVETATELGIAVANMPGANAQSVAEGTLLLMLAVMRRLVELDAATRAGRGWPTEASLGETVRDIASCTVGLVGYGNIAKRVEQMLTAMGAQVIHNSTRDDNSPEWRTLPALLAESDIVSLHLPLTSDTDNLIDQAALQSMRPNSLLVNTSRGGLVEEHALINALHHGPLAGAGLDVFAVEPVDPDNPLLKLRNVVVTPHVVWYTKDTWRRYIAAAVDNCRRLRDGKDLRNVVNGRQGVRPTDA